MDDGQRREVERKEFPAGEETPETERRVLSNAGFEELLAEPLDEAQAALHAVGGANGLGKWSGLLAGHIERCLKGLRGNMSDVPAEAPVSDEGVTPTTERPCMAELDRAERALRTVRTRDTILYMAAITHIGSCCSDWHAERLREIRAEMAKENGGESTARTRQLDEQIRTVENAVAQMWPLDHRRRH